MCRRWIWFQSQNRKRSLIKFLSYCEGLGNFLSISPYYAWLLGYTLTIRWGAQSWYNFMCVVPWTVARVNFSAAQMLRVMIRSIWVGDGDWSCGCRVYACLVVCALGEDMDVVSILTRKVELNDLWTERNILLEGTRGKGLDYYRILAIMKNVAENWKIFCPS